MSWLRRNARMAGLGIGVVLVALSSFLIASYRSGALPWLDRRPLRERIECGRCSGPT